MKSLTYSSRALAAASLGLAMLASMFAFALPASAHQDPAGCSANGVGVSLSVYRSDETTVIGGGDTVAPGEVIKYRTTLSALGLPNCNYSMGTLTITTPDGATDVTPGGGIPLVSVGSPFVSNFVSYTVDSAEVGGDDDIDAATNYSGGASHIGTIHDSASGSVTKQTPFKKLTPTAVTDIHNAAEAVVLSVGEGSTVHDKATVTGSGPVPTGTVDFAFFSNNACEGQGAVAGSVALAGGVAHPSTSQGPLAAGSYSFKAHYNGDANYEAADAPCEPLTVIPKGHIVVDKVTVPAADPQSFTFTTTGAGYAGFGLTDAAAVNDQALDAGTYTVAETAVAGWTQTSATCVSSNQDVETPGNISLQAGETVTCTFTNTKKGHLIVEKTTVPAADPASFSITASGNGTITGGGAGSITDANDKDYEVTPGTYSVVEAAKAGWAETSNTCSNVVVAAGETKHCLITNTKQSTVIVKKVMVGGTSTFGFTGTPAGQIGSNNGTISSPVAPGQYVSTETAKDGWDLTSVTCDDNDSTGSVQNANATFNVAAGETVTCTFTNTKKPTLRVNKVLVPANNAGVFNLQIDGNTAGTGANVGNGGTTGVIVSTIGAHTVGETAGNATNLSDYTAVIGGDCAADGSVTLAAGDAKVCTITNTLKTGHLIVQKTTNPGGDPTSFSITASGTGTITGGGAGSITDANDKDYAVTPGTYNVVEAAKAGWTETSNTCKDVVVGPGETKTCEIVNTKNPVAQYCSPGYWKQPQHFDSYEGTGYTHDQLFSTVGSPAPSTPPLFANAFPGKTLVQVLSTGGGGLSMLGRATVAGLMNAAQLDSGLETADVISIFNTAYAAGTKAAYDAAAKQFTAPENCPLN